MVRMRQFLILTLALVLASCGGSGKQGNTSGKNKNTTEKKAPEKVSFGSLLPSIFFSDYVRRKASTGTGYGILSKR